MTSIRSRLLATLLVLWTVIWGAIALVVVERSQHEVEELLDAELAQMALVLRSIGLIGNLADLGPQGQSLASLGHQYETRISFQLWDGDELLARLGAAPEERLADRLGFSDQSFGTYRWRVFGLPCSNSERELYVAQDYEIRRELVRYLTFNALQPMLWSLPLALLLIWLAVTDGLRPLSRLARDVATRSDRRLEPISDEAIPSEVRPLIAALNELMQQVRRSLALERRFSADASHELRTPMAIIRTHAQIARRSTDPAQREQALDNVSRGIDRAARVAGQMLALSRVRHDRPKRDGDSASLLLAVTEVVEDRRAVAKAAGLHLELQAPGLDVCVVGMSASMLRVLVANLVDNAIKFTPAGGRVLVTVNTDDDDVRLAVSDTGPGIPAGRRERVFYRFYREPGQEEPGAGLGLSIVKRICDQYGARIRLEDAVPPAADTEAEAAGRGLRVEVLFPVPRMRGQ
jgi:signal transduction histidine kinase